MKKTLAIALCFLLALAAASCGGQPVAPSGATSAAPGTSATAASQGSEPSAANVATANGEPTETSEKYFKYYDDPIDLTTHMAFSSTWTWHSADDNENSNGLTRWIKDHTNINFSCSWNAPDDATNTQKLDLAFASNTLPDVIQASSSQIAKYAAAGKLADMGALIEAYGSPLLKYAIQEAQDLTQGTFYLPYSYGGTAYALPIMCDTLVYWWLPYVRGDLLDELGMAVPSTLDEMEAAFAAYKEKHPDGVALGMDNELIGLRTVMAGYEAYPGSWVEKGGQAVYGSIQPEVRQGLERLADWYRKGYLDPEFVTKDMMQLLADAGEGKVFSLYTAWNVIGGNFQDMWANVEGSRLEVMPFPAGPDGKSGIATKVAFSPARAVSAACEHPEALVYLLNQYWDSFYRNNLELRQTMKDKYGYEFHYPVTEVREEINKAEREADPALPSFYDYPEELTGFGYFNDYVSHYSWLYGLTGVVISVANDDFGQVARGAKGEMPAEDMTVSARSTFEGWGSTPQGGQMLATFAEIYDYWEPLMGDSQIFHVDAFTGPTTPAMLERQSYLDKLEAETFTRIIMGTQPIEAFDSFVGEWLANGGEDITREVNEWISSASPL
ncbi:MAG: extracellular solute-binding protein [Clostridiales bacterium]|nr:extracellular solute-binding protein [Clostridiales bacterium]